MMKAWNLQWVMLAGLCAVLAACGSTPAPSGAAEIRTQLTARYPERASWKEGEFMFRPASEVAPVRLETLGQVLPHVQFFRTQLDSGHMEYRNVETVVALGEGKEMVTCFSPMYSDSDPRFLAVFKGIPASTVEQEGAVSKDIALLFAAITSGGAIRSETVKGAEFTADLWHREQLWRKIVIEFADGKLKSIALLNPRQVGAR
jgi:hypothetical protein